MHSEEINEHSRRVAAATVKSLVDDFGFDPEKSERAVDTIGDKGDVQLAISWLLDHGEEDRGGAISLKRCPHIDFEDTKLVDKAKLRFGCPCSTCGSTVENWTCLFSGETFCSRYVHKHGLAHWHDTKSAAEASLTVADAAAGKEALGHHLTISQSDLSVWCHACQAYVEHDRLTPLVSRMRELKFGTSSAAEAQLPSEAEDTEVEAAPIARVLVGDAMVGATELGMHGSLGQGHDLAPPRVTVACDTAARPGYRSCAAHEYCDTPEVLDAKVGMLAKMFRAAQHPIAYTGAGISTAAGIRDYATKGRAVGRDGLSPLEAQPSAAHTALVAMHAGGVLRTWINQNHDGLPQKAGMPQSAVNEIHGAWFDPSNPVVPMDGTLRQDLLRDLAETEEQADLCLVLGTSLCGMNADRVATTPARKARQRNSRVLGTCIVNLQRTVVDEQCQLRIFAPIDEVLAKLTAKLGLTAGSDTHLGAPSAPHRPPWAHSGGVPPGDADDAPVGLVDEIAAVTDDRYTSGVARVAAPVADGSRDVFVVPYTAAGDLVLDGRTTTTLDLRPGAQLRLLNQPDWDVERCGSLATVQRRTADGHWVVKLATGGDRAVRTLGGWWVAEALEGRLARLPAVSVAPPPMVAGAAA